MNAEDGLVSFASALTFASVPRPVIDKTRNLILDSLGCALAGSTAPGVDAVVRTAVRWGGAAESTLVAHSTRVPSLMAALVNGTMSNARDFDDTHDKAVLRTQTSVLSAALAMGEAEGGRSGRDLIVAVTAGTEMLCRMGLARLRGMEFLPTATLASVAAAATAARIAHLPAETVLNACGIAYSQCAGNMQPVLDGATVKRLHPGFAAMVGVLSANLAREGISGARRFLEGQYGYYNLYERGDYVSEPLTADLGERYDLMDLSIKPYPCARECHGAVESALSLAAENDLGVDDVGQVIVWLPPNAFKLSGKPFGQGAGHPVVEAILSAAYGVAAAILRRRVELDDYQEEAVMDPAVRALAKRVTVELHPEVSDPVALVPQTVKITLRDGRVLERSIPLLKGHPDRPVDRDEALAKFQGCCRLAARPVSAERARAIVETVDHLDEVDDVRKVGDLLAL